MGRPLCFVLMPRGTKSDPAGALVDFDAVYRSLVAPAVENSGMDPLRADQDFTEDGNLNPLFEQFLLCPFAVADLTLANANLYHELGVRHANRPGTTVTLSSNRETTAFRTGMLRTVPYSLASDGAPAEVQAARHALTSGLDRKSVV